MGDSVSLPRRGRPRKPPGALGPELSTLRAARMADPRSDREIGEAAGLDATTVSAVIRGDKPNPPLSTLRGLLRALGLPWATFDGAE